MDFNTDATAKLNHPCRVACPPSQSVSRLSFKTWHFSNKESFRHSWRVVIELSSLASATPTHLLLKVRSVHLGSLKLSLLGGLDNLRKLLTCEGK